VRFRLIFASDLLTNHRGWYVDEVRLDYLDSATVEVQSPGLHHPARTALEGCYPNPFNPAITIRFTLAEECIVVLGVFDVLGREVATPVQGRKSAGSYVTTWQASDMPSGMYFIRMSVGRADGVSPPSPIAARKVVLIK
jgi:hypothetical protein